MFNQTFWEPFLMYYYLKNNIRFIPEICLYEFGLGKINRV